MATSIGQYTPVFLPGEPPEREVWQATVHSIAKSWTRPKQPCMLRCKTFFACGSSAPVRVESEGGAASWLAGTLVAPTVQGHRLPPPQELRPYQSLFFEPLVSGNWKASLASLSPKLCPFRHLEGSLAWGPPLLFHT